MEIMLLNLDRSQDRLRYFRDVNRHLTNVTRVSAVDGSSLDRQALLRDGTISADLPYTPGAVGAALSHGKLWQKAIDEDRPITVSEDDALFSYFFEEKSRVLLQGIDSDWDFVLWGYALKQFIWVETIPGSVASEIRFASTSENFSFENFQFTTCSWSLMRMLHSFTYICYSVSPRGAKKLRERCFPMRHELIPFRYGGIVIQNEGIDCIANVVYPLMKSYVCVAPLATAEYRLASTIR